MSQPMTLTQWYARRAASAAHPTLTSLPAVRHAGRAAAVASPPAAALPAAALPATPAPGALASARAWIPTRVAVARRRLGSAGADRRSGASPATAAPPRPRRWPR